MSFCPSLRICLIDNCRYSALEVLFDTLTYHGSAFTPEFWTRIFDSVLLSIFDHVRAEVHMSIALLITLKAVGARCCEATCAPEKLGQTHLTLCVMTRAHDAQVTDTTTFTDEARRAEVDAWLYDTCTQCLQHMVDLVAQFYPAVQPLLPRILALLDDFIR